MIFICVKFSIRPELADEWIERTAGYTAGTRSEPGNIFFEWSRSVDDPNQFVLLEAFQDGTAEAHVTAPHFLDAMEWMPDYVATVPDIISQQGVEGDGWGKMAEVKPRS